MASRAREIFTTIRTEGGLLPSDLLARVARGDPGLEGLDPDSYHLAGGERLNEAINRAWNRLVGAWASFQARLAELPEDDLATSLTRERWLLILFQELGYGRLQAAHSTEIDGKAYPVSHFWMHCPIHLVGCRVDMDRRTAGVAGAARTSPHSLVQEFLNRSEDSLWGFVSNGLRLRILRDNVSLTRLAYVEFDMKGMMDGEVYSDFALLWQLCHQSRVEAEKPHECWLERWSVTAQKEGTRALESLRKGVECAISALGSGFLAHPANADLRQKLRSGALSTQDYYRQLLRLVYRLLFLFVAEDRELLLDPAGAPDARERYTRFYSTARLRRLAERRRGTKHADVFRGLRVVMAGLGSDDGCPALALPALGSMLWSREAVPDLEPCDVANRDLLEAVRALAFTVEGKVLRSVDYKNLGSEELGSVYESLLELHPEMNAEAATFNLTVAAGHERKTTGSYYTPTSLVNCLLDSALDPVLEEAAWKPEPEKAILGLKVCDPACGSGHFLIAAAHRIARRLAAVRTGDEEPAPEAYRHALRDVIGHCIYGVDINPMAVELCKVNLWLEALEPGRPLSFLDHRIKCGNSLLGTTPSLMAEGIPDDAFKPITGDDKDVCAADKKQNRQEREGQALYALPGRGAQPWERQGELAVAMAQIDAIEDDTVQGVRAKQERYERLVKSTGYLYGHLLADMWCAAFVWRKRKEVDGGLPYAVTESVFRECRRDPRRVPPWLIEEVQRLARQYGFFHWQLEFPDAFQSAAVSSSEARMGEGGFDIVLGNPPWDTLSPDAKEFFSTYDLQVRFQDRDGQQRIIDELLRDPTIAQAWEANCRDLYALVHFLKNSGRYQMFAPGNLGKGDFNVYRMFVEAALSLTRRNGWASQIVPEGLYNGANCMAIRRALYESCRLDCLLGFENTREAWFPGVHTAMKFCLYAAHIGLQTDSFRAAFGIRSHDQLAEVRAGLSLNIPVRLVKVFSPDALAVMELGSQMDIDIAARMYRWPAFGEQAAGPARRIYMREIDMGTDRDLFSEDPTGVPLYEGRMVDQFDHCAKGYRSGRGRAADWEDLPFGSPEKSIQPQWYIPRDRVPSKCRERISAYRVGFCDVASPTNERTLVAALLPPGIICGDKVPTITFEGGESGWQLAVWIAIANSYAMDFIARKKVSLKMSYTVVDSLPFPRLDRGDHRAHSLISRCVRLSCTGHEMIPFWNQMAVEGWVPEIASTSAIPGELQEESRLQLRAEIDAIVARDLFELTRPELEYILMTFPTQQRYQEEKYGEFRSRRLILEAFEQLRT